MTPDDTRLIHEKLDKLTEAVSRLVLIEDRQAAQNERMAALDRRLEVAEVEITKVDRKVDRWVQRGIGAYSLAATAFAVWQAFGGRLPGAH
jgi:hypothetical protein